MWITAFFTKNGIPETSLSATIRIRNISDNSLVVTDDAMVEIGDGFYKYNFLGYNADIDYSIRCDGSNVLQGNDRYTYGGNEMFDDILDDIKIETDKIQSDIIDVPDNYKDKMSEGDLHTGLDSYINKNDYKANVSGMALETTVQNIQTETDKIKYILGLTQQNYRIFSPIYDGNHNLISAIIKIYPTAIDTNNDTNVIREYSMVATFNGIVKC